MAIQTIWPDSTVSTIGTWTLVGAATRHAALSDGNDSSYVIPPQGAGYYLTLGLGDYIIPPASVVKQARIGIRFQGGVGGPLGKATTIKAEIVDPASGKSRSFQSTRTNLTALATVYSGWFSTDPGGANWGQTVINALQMRLSQPSTASTAHIYSVFVEFDVNTAPTATLSNVATGNSRPPIVFTYSDAEGDAMQDYQVKIFTAAVRDAAGFDFFTSPALFDSGIVYASQPPVGGVIPDIDFLPNSGTYWAYVVVRQRGSTGAIGRSAPTGISWVPDYASPASPILVASATNDTHADDANGSRTSAPWTGVHNCTITPSGRLQRNGGSSFILKSLASGVMWAGRDQDISGLIPGEVWTLTAYSRAVGGVVTATRVQVNMLANGVLTAPSSANITNNNTSWGERTVDVTIPEGLTALVTYLMVQSPAGANEEHAFDDIVWVRKKASLRTALSIVGQDNQLTEEDSNFTTSIGSWINAGNATLARSTAQAAYGGASLAVTAAAAGDVVVTTGLYAVLPGQRITVYAETRPNTTVRSRGLYVQWFTAASVYISDSAVVYSRETASAFTPTITGGVVAPPTAAFYRVLVRWPSCAASEVHYLDKIKAGPYTNLIPEDASGFERDDNSLAGWIGRDQASGFPQLATTNVLEGSKSVKYQSAGGGFGDMYQNFPAKPSQYYLAYMSILPLGTVRTAQLFIYALDAALASLGSFSASRSEVSGSYEQVVLSAFLAPAGTNWLQMYPQALNPASGEQHQVDHVGIIPLGAQTDYWTIGGYLAYQAIEVERSTDGGTTWEPIRSSVAAGALSDIHESTVLYDYEVASDVSAVYRARSVVKLPAGDRRVSQWSPVTSAVTLTDDDWRLSDPTDPGNNIELLVIGDSVVQQKSIDQATFSPMGRTRKVVVSDVVRGEEGSLTIEFLEEAKYLKFEDLRNSGKTLLLSRGWTGEQWHVRFTEVREMSLFNYSPTYRHVRVNWVEVDAP